MSTLFAEIKKYIGKIGSFLKGKWMYIVIGVVAIGIIQQLIEAFA